MTTVVVPAHNESQVIGRLLARLVHAAPPGGAPPTPDPHLDTPLPDPDLHVIVVANGCNDDTAEVAASFGPRVRVLSIAVASKRAALAAGDSAARDFPRVYVDADIELGAQDVRALAEAVRQPGVLAAAPERALSLAASSWPVRWYYDVWMRLPEVLLGLWGRGVIAVSELGHERLAGLPPLLADDLAASLSFAPGERRIVPGARAISHPPRTIVDLLRRRVRAYTGVAQIGRTADAPPSSERTRMSDLLAITRSEPRMAPRVALFLAVAVVARLRARRAVGRGDYSTWLRDESSRRAPAVAGQTRGDGR